MVTFLKMLPNGIFFQKGFFFIGLQFWFWSRKKNYTEFIKLFTILVRELKS